MHQPDNAPNIQAWLAEAKTGNLEALYQLAAHFRPDLDTPGSAIHKQIRQFMELLEQHEPRLKPEPLKPWFDFLEEKNQAGVQEAAWLLSLWNARPQATVAEQDKKIPLAQRLQKELEAQAEVGNSLAMSRLGLMYAQGELGDPDYQEAKSWWLKAAEQGRASAMFNLGLMYAQGELGDPNHEEAKKWWLQAREKLLKEAKSGDSKILSRLWYLYKITKIKDKKAEEERLRFAATYNPKIFHILSGLFYRKILGEDLSGEVRIQKGHEFYFRARKQGAKNDFSDPFLDLILGYVPGADQSFIEAELHKIKAASKEILREKRVNKSFTLVHFTKKEVAFSLVEAMDSQQQRKGHLRYSPYFGMNDPHEGRSLIDFLKNNEDKKLDIEEGDVKVLEDVFGAYEKSMEGGGFNRIKPFPFLMCFTQENDRLDLWRAYGDDGKGVSLSIPYTPKSPSNSDENFDVAHRYMMHSDWDGVKEVLPSSQEFAQLIPCSDVYKVTYLENKEDISDVVTYLKRAIKARNIILKKLGISPGQKEQNNLKESVDLYFAFHFITIMYLYKDEQYATEKEVRAIALLSYDDPRVQFAPDSNRIYANSDLKLFTQPGARITLGPKVPEAELHALRYKAFQNPALRGLAIAKSKVPYKEPYQ